jgi:long-chain acyl-CoA synthetase
MSCGVTIAFAESIDSLFENLREVRPTVVTTVPRLFERFYGRVMKQVDESSRFRRTLFSWSVRRGLSRIRARKAGATDPLSLVLYTVADRLVFRKIRKRLGGRIRFFVSGGAALSSELGNFFDAAGIRILEGYGLTEASPVISVNRMDDYRFGTVGKLLPGVNAKIASDGEILVHGPNVMSGYWNDAAATAEAIDREGWLHTGDIGSFDADGFLRITDRKKHLFVTSGGKNIAPQPIEHMFTQNAMIDQFVLIGDGRMYLSALIVPNFEQLREYASRHQLSCSTAAELVGNTMIRGMMGEEINRIQKDMANFERVRKFTILDRSLTIEEGELTPLLKVRRKIVEEKFKNLIDAMYTGVS